MKNLRYARVTPSIDDVPRERSSPCVLQPRNRMIPVYRPSFTGKEKEYVNQCLDSTWISSKGEFI